MVFNKTGFISPLSAKSLDLVDIEGIKEDIQGLNDTRIWDILSAGGCCYAYLDQCPLELPEGIVIGALTDRLVSNLAIVIKNEAIDLYADFRLVVNATIMVPSPIIGYQIQGLRPDVKWAVDTNIENVDACIIMERDVVNIPISYTKYTLQPTDMVPPISCGIVAVLVDKKNVEGRTALKLSHNKTLGFCSNVERNLAKMCVGENITLYSAYCTIDKNGYYHAVAVAQIDGKIKKASLSQSTYSEMASLLFYQLTH
jgi:hydroxymethylbilane synthase